MAGSTVARVMLTTLEHNLRAGVGDDIVLAGVAGHYLVDATEARGTRGHADAVAVPRTPDEVAAVVRWCYDHDVPIVPRGGGTGFAGGSVAIDGGVVLSLERLQRVRSFDPLLWRMEVEAGVTTAHVRRLARENGLLFPPDPGAAEQSQIGGNAATNAGGPHALKYGVTGGWITGVEAVIPPGDVVAFGGSLRKDVAGYDVKNLLVGSEGTLGVITAVWLRFIPAPEAALPVVALYPSTQAGCLAIESVLGHGLQASALEYLDAAAVLLSRNGFPVPLPDGGGFMVVAEADGDAVSARATRDELVDCLARDAVSVHALDTPDAISSLWRWRDGVSLAVQVARGGKLSEDIAVPLDRLADAIEGTHAIGRRHGLETCSWGHAGDGNLHATFLLDPTDNAETARAEAAAGELFELAVELGGTLSGEHGVGFVKAPFVKRQFSPTAIALHERVKASFDPKGLLNPGKKL